MNGMTNSAVLDIVISCSGIPRTFLAQRLGITEKLFDMKVNGKADFTCGEVQILANCLCMSDEVVQFIFFNTVA